MKTLTKSLIKHRHVRILGLLGVSSIALFITVDPRSASAAWLFAGFMLVAATVFSLALAVNSLLYKERKKLHKASYYTAGVVVVMIGLQSIGQLTPRDVLTLLPFVAGVYWYVHYNKRLAAESVPL